eukprot:3457163-Alexandrium_andersonii.AAC.1
MELLLGQKSTGDVREVLRPRNSPLEGAQQKRKEAGGNPRHPGELVRGPPVWATNVLRIGPKDPKDRPLIEVRQIRLRE